MRQKRFVIQQTPVSRPAQPTALAANRLDIAKAKQTVSLSPGRLMWRRFLRNRLALFGAILLVLLYLTILCADFLSPTHYNQIDENRIFVPPQLPQFFDQEGRFHLRPFVYGLQTTLDMNTFRWVHEPDHSQVYPIYFFVRGYEYHLLGIIPLNRHLYGVEEPGDIYLFGSDSLGRDMLSRVLAGARISLTIGLVGVALTIVFGATLGTISGYYGGIVDTLMQRVIEFLMSFPAIPLWAALAAAMPPNWSAIQRFFAISIILSLIEWTGLARQVRAKVLSYRVMDYTTAARSAGASDARIIFRHMVPNSFSHIIVIATLAIPGVILAETALSFLGLGIQPPLTSWGALLQEAQSITVLLHQPWLLIPAIFVIATVLSFNFLGDGLRDAVDPFAP
jgi:peptide/nickel transport system permease protein